jgi:formylglycine-generating enzyme required for sulfatase activity
MVSNVTVAQRPGTKLVDIGYDLAADGPVEISIRISADDGATWTMPATSLSGAVGIPITAGTGKAVVWDSGADWNGHRTTQSRVEIRAVDTAYLVIDLSAGPSAGSYPVTYLVGAPVGGWTVEYKTTKLVLRLIPRTNPAFTMGSPTGELGRSTSADETQHQVTLTQNFYIGVFEVTQKQWERVMGSWPSFFSNTGVRDARPVEKVSYSDIRGSYGGAGWPASNAVNTGSFVGRLRQRTGLTTLDLPAESQWEYACRAGTAAALNNGTNLTSTTSDPNLNILGRNYYNGGSGYSQNCGLANGTAAVGSYLPNAWGLYDMHGNVGEWCLDWYGAYLGTVTDPRGAATGSFRVVRGGCWSGGAMACRSAYRYSYNYLMESSNSLVGCRVALTVP